jgi:pimeloyl-ACP methyl ester carboxylesterase
MRGGRGNGGASGRRVLSLGWCAVLAVLVGACGSSGSADPTAVKGKFDVGGRSLYLTCSGAGSPTVVMDAGLGNSHDTWKSVAPAVTKLTQTCTYDRANMGDSDPAPKPRSSNDVVADLHRLLAAAAIHPPYLLVGHSFGGLNMRLFASNFPAEVGGLLLVDPTPTTFLADECAVVDPSLCATLRADWNPSKNSDGLSLEQSSREVDSAAPLPNVPLVVLAATEHKQPAVTEKRAQAAIEAAWRNAEAKLAGSLPHGKLVVVSSGHDIQQLHPEAVISALKSMLTPSPPP